MTFGAIFEALATMKNSITPDSVIKLMTLPYLSPLEFISTQVSAAFMKSRDSSCYSLCPVRYGMPEYNP